MVCVGLLVEGHWVGTLKPLAVLCPPAVAAIAGAYLERGGGAMHRDAS